VLPTLGKVLLRVIYDVVGNRFNPPRYVSAEDRVLWFEQPITHQADQEWLTAHERPVAKIYGRCTNLDQDLILLGHRFRDLLEPQHVRRPVFFTYDRFHEYSSCTILMR
jgi:hypothetical protein